MPHLSETHPYYAQVQGEMAILNVEWCDFVVYSNGSVIVDRILADYDYWTKMCEVLDEFYIYHIGPEILSGRVFKAVTRYACVQVSTLHATHMSIHQKHSMIG